MRKYRDELKEDLEEEFPLASPDEIEAMLDRDAIEHDIANLEYFYELPGILRGLLELVPDPKEKFRGRTR